MSSTNTYTIIAYRPNGRDDYRGHLDSAWESSCEISCATDPEAAARLIADIHIRGWDKHTAEGRAGYDIIVLVDGVPGMGNGDASVNDNRDDAARADDETEDDIIDKRDWVLSRAEAIRAELLVRLERNKAARVAAEAAQAKQRREDEDRRRLAALRAEIADLERRVS